MSISSFNDRFTPQMEKFLKKCAIHALEYQAQEPVLKLWIKLKKFKDILIQDSTINRLHESLASLWPAARSKKVAAIWIYNRSFGDNALRCRDDWLKAGMNMAGEKSHASL